MNKQPTNSLHISCQISSITYAKISVLALAVILTLMSTDVRADSDTAPKPGTVFVERIASDTGEGYGYRVEYIVPAPINKFWLFKTDFDSDFLLTNDELLDHRIVRRVGNAVVTENRFAFAPGLRFLWKTTVFHERHRLEFELLNTKDTRHDFHYGSIQLTPMGKHTRVTQIAFFNFRGASLWVKYPWYGGMKYTLTKNARWEQKVASRYQTEYVVAKRD